MAGIKVAFFLPSLGGGGGGPGGAERITLNLAEALMQRGYDVDLVLARFHQEFTPMVPDGARVVDLQTEKMSRSFLALARYLRSERPYALMSALDHGNVSALWAKRLARVGTRVVVANHIQLSIATAHETDLPSKLIPWFVRHSYGAADAIVSVSNGAAEDLSRITGIPREGITVIHNPVISSRMFTLAEEPVGHPWLLRKDIPVVLSAGRLSQQKHFDLLLRAFSILVSRTPVRLIILGEGEERGNLEFLARQLGIEKSVSFPGWTPNAYPYMRSSDLFAMSSRWEALPTVLVEALALGMRVVATDCRSGPAEIHQGGKLGKLVPVEDPILLADAMEKSLKEPVPPPPTEFLRSFEVSVATDAYIQILALSTNA